MKPLGIYIHIPFCMSKCNYCDFYSIGGADEEKKDRYISALVRHMQEYKIQAKNYIVSSVYIGGGTPSLLSESQLKSILKAVRKNFRISSRCEISMEVNPGTVTESKLKSFRKAGVNRLSIGAQSFNDEELSVCGRKHKMVNDFFKCRFKPRKHTKHH